ncbi:ATP-binding protein [Brevundimonas sp.]|uniref:hybrid sensor histidine kinase/response regulator n=1 Tax=Brevundimonas sp. TaxID=1871086 RepID=UPI00286B24C5|nr:ATP-binding protein [Brevundimonas sp.]
MVHSFGLLNEPRAPQHDEVAALASDIAETQWGVVSLVGGERNWFSGSFNYSDDEACRWTSFCTHVVANPDSVLWVADARSDFRFAKNPHVLENPRIRFYAGAPVVVNGLAIGAVGVFDPDPRAFDSALARSLSRLASIIAEDLAARHQAQSRQVALLASADAIVECDDRGTIIDWSEGAEQLFGFPVAEALGGNIDMIVPAEFKAEHRRGIERWRVGGGARVGRRIELVACHRDGHPIDIELWMSVAHQHGVPHIHANIRDISERKARSSELRLATAQAKAANEAKSIFLANMSHELRTPLNGVIAVADLLAKTEQSDYQCELTSLIRESSDHLGNLIGDILDLARIESGELVLSDTPMTLSEIVESVLGLSSLAAQEKGLTLSAELAPDITGQVMGDPLRLKQVLANLITNAVRFTEQGSVSLRVSREGDQHRFEVRDTGPGFDDAQREVIFGRFHQADGTITRRFGGTGLGLSISRELVAAMGGDIDCRGEPGNGATFWFTVPLAGAQADPDVEAVNDASTPGLRRILVVDDNATNRRVAELILQTIGVEVDCVEDGDQAVEAFMAGQYDAILMDMMMPVMDGIAATDAIRTLETKHGRARTPVVMLTANTLPQHVEACLEAGADLHLSKPVSAAGLFEALDKVRRVAEAPGSSRETAVA